MLEVPSMSILDIIKPKTLRIYSTVLFLFLIFTIIILSIYSNFVVTFTLIWATLGIVMIIDRYYSMKYLEFQEHLKENKETAIAYYKIGLSKPTSKTEENLLVQKQIEKKGIKAGFFGINLIIGFIMMGIVFMVVSILFSFQGLNFGLITFWVYVAFYGGFICRQSTGVIKKLEEFTEFEESSK